METRKKNAGQVFTPPYIVNMILDDIGYTKGNIINGSIINRRIIEPSFGEGVFLKEIVRRYIEEAKLLGMSKYDIAEGLSNCIYGIEIDKKCYDMTMATLNTLVKDLGINTAIHWNLFNVDALLYDRFDFFDYVVGNPPYIRIHNLSADTREHISKCSFSSGMTDIYVTFFELGIRLLNNTGKLGYITPNSYFRNSSQYLFRKYILEKNLISEIKDFGSYHVFDGTGTYTAITILDKNKSNNTFVYYRYDSLDSVSYQTEYDNSCFLSSGKNILTLSDAETKSVMADIYSRKLKMSDICNIRNGFATNNDNVFITQEIIECPENKNLVIFNDHPVEKEFVKKIVKGSRYDGKNNQWILFPYGIKNGKYCVIPESVMIEKYPETHGYFVEHMSELKARNMPEKAMFYEFGRNQGINTCHYKKLVISPVFRPCDDVRIFELPEDVFVYSGLFITEKEGENSVSLETIKRYLSSEEFKQYASVHGRKLSGGYFGIDATVIKEYRPDIPKNK